MRTAADLSTCACAGDLTVMKWATRIFGSIWISCRQRRLIANHGSAERIGRISGGDFKKYTVWMLTSPKGRPTIATLPLLVAIDSILPDWRALAMHEMSRIFRIVTKKSRSGLFGEVTPNRGFLKPSLASAPVRSAFDLDIVMRVLYSDSARKNGTAILVGLDLRPKCHPLA